MTFDASDFIQEERARPWPQTLVGPGGFDLLALRHQTIDNWQRHGSGAAELAANVGEGHARLIRAGAIVCQTAAQFRPLRFGDGGGRLGLGHTLQQVAGETKTFSSIQHLKLGQECLAYGQIVPERSSPVSLQSGASFFLRKNF